MDGSTEGYWASDTRLCTDGVTLKTLKQKIKLLNEYISKLFKNNLYIII